MSCVAVEHAGMDDPVKFGDSRSNHSRDIRAALFVMGDDDDTSECRSSHKGKKTPYG